MKTKSKRPTEQSETGGELVVVQPSLVAIPDSMREVIAGIPVDPEAKLDAATKRMFIAKLTQLRLGRKQCSEEMRNEKERKLLEEYRKSVGFDKILARLDRKKAEVVAILDELADVGLHANGNIACQTETVYNRTAGTSRTVKLKYGNHISAESLKSTREADVSRVVTKIELVIKMEDVFSDFDALEMRMSMASTYREAVTIINAAAGTNVLELAISGMEVVPKV